ncbi:MAG: flagellar motor switch protein FliM [Candidatus Hydrogenedentes bacterium]|nr:flagellar motor switch protein FliM [Candidatus Hydrogenedentota bacterium]
MVDILSQEEIDLLLGSVTTGALQDAIKEEKEEVKGAKISVYDFRRPERISKEQLKGLQSIFEAFARELTIVLPPYFRTVVRVDLVAIDQITYDEFILAISRPTCLVVVNLSPLEGAGVLELSPSAVFPIIDRVLGGKGKSVPEYRELTEIEERIVGKVVDMMLGSLKRAWEQIIELNAKVDTIESDPLIVQIVAGSEMVILVSYDIHLGENKGTINFCIPFMVLNPLIEQISKMAHYAHRVSPEVAIKTKIAILKLLLGAPMRLDTILGRATVRVSDLMELEKGDVLILNQRTDDPVVIEIEGHPKFKGTIGRRGEEMAVRISRIIREEKSPEQYL